MRAVSGIGPLPRSRPPFGGTIRFDPDIIADFDPTPGSFSPVLDDPTREDIVESLVAWLAVRCRAEAYRVRMIFSDVVFDRSLVLTR